jgi:hypothetical protein
MKIHLRLSGPPFFEWGFHLNPNVSPTNVKQVLIHQEIWRKYILN